MAKTENPKEYLGSEAYPEGVYNGHNLSRAGMNTIWSVGKDPTDAILSLCVARFKEPETTEVDLFLEVSQSMSPLEKGDPDHEWGFRFVCEGTGFKAAGINVPGGVILTWWK